MIVTLEDVRIASVTAIESAKAVWPHPLTVEYAQLASVNLDTQSEPFLSVSLNFGDGYQINLGKNGGNRLIGMLVLEVKYKEGTGLSKANAILEHFYRRIHMTDAHYPLRTYAAKPSSRPPIKGWRAIAAIIPFWCDSIPDPS